MEWVETTGRTVAEALDAALDQLGVDEQEAEFEILQEAQKGLFGRLRTEARVRARVRPVLPRPKTERRDRRRRGNERDGRSRRRGGSSSDGGGRGGGNASGRGSKAAGASGNGGGARSEGSGSRSDRAADAGVVRTQEQDEAGVDRSDGASDDSGGGSGRRRRRRGGSGRAKEQGAAVTNQTSEAAGDVATKVADLEAQRAAVDEFLRGLVDAFGRPEAAVSVQTVEEDTVEAEVNGEELGLLVGPKGQTLQAIHELVRSMVQRRFVGEAHARVRVDVAGYRQRRREALERFTRTVADQVQSTGRAVVLDPMGASDRKTVHDVVNELEGVKTVSEGEEPARRVIIQPV